MPQTDKAFGIAPCSYQEILELDDELIAFERSLPSVYMLPIDNTGRVHVGFPPSLTHMRAVLINLCLAAELLRLHRPFLGALPFSATVTTRALTPLSFPSSRCDRQPVRLLTRAVLEVRQANPRHQRHTRLPHQLGRVRLFLSLTT